MADPTNTRNNSGTGFTNYNDVLNANQASGKQLGTTVANGLESQGNAVNQNLQGQQNTFNTGLTNAQNDFNTVSQYANQLAAGATAGDWNAVAGVSDPGTLATNGQTFSNYTYGGPSGLSDASGLQAQAQAASQTGDLANTAQGQQQLLGQYVGGQNYNQGESQFDQALLNKYGQGQVGQAKKSLVGLGQQADNAVAGAQTAAQNQGNYITNTKNTDIQAITNGLGNQSDQTGNSVLGQANQQANTFYNNATDTEAMLRALQSGNSDTINAEVTALQGKGQDPTALLNNVSQMGLNQGDTYYKGGSAFNQANIDKLIGNYTNAFSAAPGGQYFQGDQQKAAENLASFLPGDSDLANSIQNNAYNTNVFNPGTAGAASLAANNAALNTEQNTDQTAQQLIGAYNANLNAIGSAGINGAANGSISLNGSVDPSNQNNYNQSLAIQPYLSGTNAQYNEYLNGPVQSLLTNNPGTPLLSPTQPNPYKLSNIGGYTSPFQDASNIAGQQISFSNLLNNLLPTSVPSSKITPTSTLNTRK